MLLFPSRVLPITLELFANCVREAKSGVQLRFARYAIGNASTVKVIYQLQKVEVAKKDLVGNVLMRGHQSGSHEHKTARGNV